MSLSCLPVRCLSKAAMPVKVLWQEVQWLVFNPAQRAPHVGQVWGSAVSLDF